MKFYQLIRPFLFKLNPELAHNLSIDLLKHNLILGGKNKNYKSLANRVFNIDFTNPIGLAAGYDKNAQTFNNLAKFGFGFVECGTVTPKPQIGNPKPRLFRLENDLAIINRMGFNNKGMDYFWHRLKNKKNPQQIVGVNIGKNKHTKNESIDYIKCLDKLYELASYITINISSPNTKNLRDIQNSQKLDNFLREIKTKKQELLDISKKDIPILLKIAPDLSDKEIAEIAEISLKNQIDGVIISNTTIDKSNLISNKYQNEQGGLSGKPLFSKSNNTLRIFYQASLGKVPIIGVGGIENAQDAYQKIKLGASLVQIYSAFIYQGFDLVEKIKKELDALIKQDGFKNISQAIGIDNKIT